VALRLLVGFINKGRGIIFIPLVAKTLGVHGYGIFSQVTITVTFLICIVTLGLREAMVRYLAGEKSGEKAAVLISTINATFLVSILSALTVGLLFKERLAVLIFSGKSYIPYIYWILSLLFSRSVYYLALSIYRAHGKVLIYSVLEVVQIAAEVGVILCLHYFDYLSIRSILAVFCAVEISLALVATLHTSYQYGVRLPDMRLAKKILIYGAPLIWGEALFQVVDVSDRFFIAHFLGMETVGVYAATYNLSKIIHMFVPAILFPLFPLVTKHWKENDRKKLDNQISLAVKIYLFLAVPMVFGLIRIYPHLLVKLTSEEFLISPMTLFFLLGAFFLVGLSYMFHFLIYVADKTYIFGVVLTLVATANVVMNYLWIPAHGMTGAALATFISYACYFLIIFFICMRIFAWTWPFKVMVFSLCAGGVMFFFLRRMPCHGIPWILVNCIAGSAVYLIGWCILARLDGSKFSDIMSNLRSLKNEAFSK
jgi:O-antigen/teichoic acid export membrane protein